MISELWRVVCKSTGPAQAGAKMHGAEQSIEKLGVLTYKTK